MSRYKLKSFDEFGTVNIDPLLGKYKSSFGMVVDSRVDKMMIPVNDLDSVDISTDADFRRLFLSAISEVPGLEVTYENSFIIPVCIKIGVNYELRIYKVTKTGAVSHIGTPVANWGGGDLYFYKIKDTIYISDDATFYEKSTNGGAAWAPFVGGVWNGPHLFNSGYYYTPDGRKRTQDGLTWDNFISITDYPFKVARLVFYKGFFHALVYERSNSYKLALVRFNDDLTWEYIYKFTSFSGLLATFNMEVFDNRIIIALYGKYVEIYSYDGNNCDLIKELSDISIVDGSDITKIKLKVLDEDNLAILVSSDLNYLYRDLILFNGDDFFPVRKGIASTIFLDVGKIGDTFMTFVDREYNGMMSNAVNYAILHDYNKKVVSLSHADTEIIDIGEIVPKQLILKSDNIPLNSSVKVYVRKNKKFVLPWVEKAPKLGAETHIYSLAVYNGKLYGSTYLNGKLYEWNGVNAWVEKAPKLGAETHIYSLAVYNGKLYGGTYPNGKLYEWNGVNAWVEKAPKLGAETLIDSLAVYNNKLYGSTYPNGKLYEWNGVNAWVEKAPQLGAETHIYSLAVYNSKLYGGTNPNGKLYEWNGVNAWVEKAPQLGAETLIDSLAVYNGKLYGGTSPNGKLYEWNGSNAWVEKAPQLGAETRIYSLAVYNNKLYGSTGMSGKLYEWNGVNAWIEKSPQLGLEIRIYSLAIYNNKLYGSTGSNGKLYEWDNCWEFLAEFSDLYSIKNVYSFPREFGSVDFLEFKIELLTSDNISITKNISFDFLYLPIGLVNSK